MRRVRKLSLGGLAVGLTLGIACIGEGQSASDPRARGDARRAGDAGTGGARLRPRRRQCARRRAHQAGPDAFVAALSERHRFRLMGTRQSVVGRAAVAQRLRALAARWRGLRVAVRRIADAGSLWVVDLDAGGTVGGRELVTSALAFVWLEGGAPARTLLYVGPPRAGPLASPSEHFDFSDNPYGCCPRVLDGDGYVRGLAAVLNRAPDAIKDIGGTFSEGYDVLTAAGYVRRGPNSYRGVCRPAWF